MPKKKRVWTTRKKGGGLSKKMKLALLLVAAGLGTASAYGSRKNRKVQNKIGKQKKNFPPQLTPSSDEKDSVDKEKYGGLIPENDVRDVFTAEEKKKAVYIINTLL